MLFLLVGVFLTGCGDDSTSSDTQTEVYLAIKNLRMELQNKLGKTVPPLSVLVQTRTETVFASAAETSAEAITAATYFRMASITKNLTATAI